MKCIIIIIVAGCLAVACVPSSAIAQTEATMESEVQAAVSNPQPEQDLQKAWPSGAEMQTKVDGFMAAGFMKKASPVGFGDLAYSDIALDLTMDGQGRISQINGVLNDLYDSYQFGIPVVGRRIDAISGSRQINWEDVIVTLESNRWLVQPVGSKDDSPLELRIDRFIELVFGDTIIRLVKDGSVFICTEHSRKADGQEELRISWKIIQYERGPVHDIQSIAESGSLVPIVMAWESGSIAGYMASLPEGEAVFAQRLRWEPAGVLETDRYNFLVLLTQRHGSRLGLQGKLGAVDPVWLALLMYDHVVNP